jgi:hypothetical protein
LFVISFMLYTSEREYFCAHIQASVHDHVHMRNGPLQEFSTALREESP